MIKYFKYFKYFNKYSNDFLTTYDFKQETLNVITILFRILRISTF